jgi:hypothetical protein
MPLSIHFKVTNCDLKIYAAMASFELVAICEGLDFMFDIALCDVIWGQRCNLLFLSSPSAFINGSLSLWP